MIQLVSIGEVLEWIPSLGSDSIPCSFLKNGGLSGEDGELEDENEPPEANAGEEEEEVACVRPAHKLLLHHSQAASAVQEEWRGHMNE